jgi:hypothetical protein
MNMYARLFYSAVSALFLVVISSDRAYARLPTKNNVCVVMRARVVGMFSVFDDILDLLERYESGFYTGVQIDFAGRGRYYEQKYGDTWWNYYMQPLALGSLAKKQAFLGGPPYLTRWANVASDRDTLKAYEHSLKAHYLIKKYFVVNSSIQKKVAAFVQKYFKGAFVIAIHYRGTDKITSREAKRVNYKKMLSTVATVIQQCDPKSDYKIFIATDEQQFINYMMQSPFKSRICFNPEIVRSKNGKPIHKGENKKRTNNNSYEIGEGALVDCLILSSSNFLICTSSNLSRWATFFNPHMPSILLKKK